MEKKRKHSLLGTQHSTPATMQNLGNITVPRASNKLEQLIESITNKIKKEFNSGVILAIFSSAARMLHRWGPKVQNA